MEYTLQNVGYSALHEAETLRLHPGQPNWQLVRVKDYKLGLALAALLSLYEQSATISHFLNFLKNSLQHRHISSKFFL